MVHESAGDAFLNVGGSNAVRSLRERIDSSGNSRGPSYAASDREARQVRRMIRGSVTASLGVECISPIYIYQSAGAARVQDVIFFGNPADCTAADREQWFNINADLEASATRPANNYRTWPFRFGNLRGQALSSGSSLRKRWRLNERGAELQVSGEAV